VGDKSGGSATFISWNGSSWTNVTPDPSVNNITLNGVSCAATNDCWAVGDSKTYAHWNGTDWSSDAADVDTGVPNTHVEAVSCVVANDCWAVGFSSGGSSLLVYWDGVIWTGIIAPALTSNLHGTACNAGNDCWAAGEGTTIGYWDGSEWTLSPVDPSIGSVQINGVSSIPPTAAESIILGDWVSGDST
jgi:hypothetical protein